MTEWQITIGLEVHAQIKSKTKLFSRAPTHFGSEPNTQLALLDVAFPGMLPVVNVYCVEQAIKAALGLGAEIQKVSRFARKNYFYPDLPQGYQISQYEQPLARGGGVTIHLKDQPPKTIHLERLHIEQDAGKNIHIEGSGGQNKSFVDLNRAGIGLMEIVSQPEIHSAAEAQAYVRALRSILRYLAVCDGNMEEGSLRADVNLSVAREGEALGTRCEMKNLNSIRAIGQAIHYEAARQIEILEGGGSIRQETRLFDSVRGETRSMRSKEDAHDYRYFPDPDLQPLMLDPAWIERIRLELPELPDAKRDRLEKEYGLTAYDASVLTAEKARADFFEEAARWLQKREIPPKLAANWILGDLMSALNKSDIPIERSPVSPTRLAILIGRIHEGVISGKIAKMVFEEMVSHQSDVDEIIERKGLKQLSDPSQIESLCDSIIEQNRDKIKKVRAKPKMLGWFVGEVMKASGGKANPQMVNALLRKRLNL